MLLSPPCARRWRRLLSKLSPPSRAPRSRPTRCVLCCKGMSRCIAQVRALCMRAFLYVVCEHRYSTTKCSFSNSHILSPISRLLSDSARRWTGSHCRRATRTKTSLILQSKAHGGGEKKTDNHETHTHTHTHKEMCIPKLLHTQAVIVRDGKTLQFFCIFINAQPTRLSTHFLHTRPCGGLTLWISNVSRANAQ